MAAKSDRYWDELLAAVLAGDKGRFREIVHEFQDELRFVAAYYLRGDRELADEVVHCAFIRAYKNLDRFERGRPLHPWLKEIVRSEALTEVRRRGRAGKMKRELLNRLLVEARADHEPPFEKLEILRRCIETLGERARRIVELRYSDRKDYKSIAEAFNSNAGAMRVAMLAIRRSLRLCVERHGA